MKKYIVIFAASLLALVSCEKQFDVKDSNYLTGTDAISIAAEDPGFLASYVNGFYSWMVEFNGGGGSHQRGRRGYRSLNGRTWRLSYAYRRQHATDIGSSQSPERS